MSDSNELNEQIYAAEVELNAMKDRKYILKEQMSEVEHDIGNSVLQEAEDGDKTLSNSQKRKVEIDRRLNNHEEYQNHNKELRRLERDINNKNAQVGLLKRRFWDNVSQRFSQVI